MSPYKGHLKTVVIHVPRHNSQRIGPQLTTQVEVIARKQKKRVDVKQTAYDPSSILSQAIESASEWNSLLMTARAERGPQWDTGTQMFHVDEGSELYFDPTPLREYEKDSTQPVPSEEEQANASSSSGPNPKPERESMAPPSHPAGPSMESPQLRRVAMQGMPHTPQQSHSVPFSPRHPGFPGGVGNFSQSLPVTPQHQQFFNGHTPETIRMSGGGMGMGSPVRQASMGGMGMHGMDGMGPMAGMSPMNMGGMGGMGGMGMGSPDMARLAAARRGPMGMEDGFPGMH